MEYKRPSKETLVELKEFEKHQKIMRKKRGELSDKQTYTKMESKD